MSDEIYRIALESNDFETLERTLKNRRLDEFTVENGLSITAATRLAREGRGDKVEWMRKLGANVNGIALGYALAGDHANVEIYREQYNANAGVIALGYALAGYHEQVEVYRTQHKANIPAIAQGYALADNDEQVKNYLHRTEYHAKVISAIAQGYALAGNHEKRKKYDINYLLDSYLQERTAVKDSSGVTKEYFHGSFFSAFQKSFTQKSNAVQALKSALQGNNVDLSEHLSTLKNGNLGKELRAFVKSGMANALVEKEVTTVSDFVQALQEKISPIPSPA